MNMNNILSYLGGYFNKNEFELDIPKIADIAELSEDEVEKELHILQSNGNIDIKNNKICLINILPTLNKKFNDLYNPVETFNWNKNTMLKLDK